MLKMMGYLAIFAVITIGALVVFYLIARLLEKILDSLLS
jgi:hypothetical protein